MKALYWLARGFLLCYFLLMAFSMSSQAYAQSGSAQTNLALIVPFNGTNASTDSPLNGTANASTPYNSDTITPIVQISDNAIPLKIWISI